MMTNRGKKPSNESSHIRVIQEPVLERLQKVYSPIGADQIVLPAWFIIEGRVRATSGQKRLAEFLVWAFIAVKNDVPEAALHALCEAYASLGEAGGWPSDMGLKELADEIVKRLLGQADSVTGFDLG